MEIDQATNDLLRAYSSVLIHFQSWAISRRVHVEI